MKNILFLLIVSILNPFALFSQQTAYNYQKIDSLLNDNSIIGGIKTLKILEKEFIKDSIHSIYWVKHASACQASYKYDKAKISIDKSVKKDSTNAQSYYNKGVFYGNIKGHKTALKAFDKAISINASVGKYYYYRGVINYQMYQFNEAERDYKEAIATNYITADLYNYYARLYLEKGDYSEALHQINIGIDLDENFAEAYSIRAMANYFLLDFEATCTDKKKALEMGLNPNMILLIPDNFCASSENEQLEFAAMSFATNGKLSYNEAINAYTKLIEKGINNSDYFSGRGSIYHQLTKLDKAEKDYLKALTLSNSDPIKIYENLIILYFKQKKYKKALEYCSLIDLGSQDGEFYELRGLIYVKLRNYKAGEKDLNKSLNINPNAFKTYANRAILYFELGDYEKSKNDAQKSVAINPTYAQGYFLLGKAKYNLKLDGYCADLLKANELKHPLAQEMITMYCN